MLPHRNLTLNQRVQGSSPCAPAPLVGQAFCVHDPSPAIHCPENRLRQVATAAPKRIRMIGFPLGRTWRRLAIRKMGSGSRSSSICYRSPGTAPLLDVASRRWTKFTNATTPGGTPLSFAMFVAATFAAAHKDSLMRAAARAARSPAGERAPAHTAVRL